MKTLKLQKKYKQKQINNQGVEDWKSCLTYQWRRRLPPNLHDGLHGDLPPETLPRLQRKPFKGVERMQWYAFKGRRERIASFGVHRRSTMFPPFHQHLPPQCKFSPNLLLYQSSLHLLRNHLLPHSIRIIRQHRHWARFDINMIILERRVVQGTWDIASKIVTAAVCETTWIREDDNRTQPNKKTKAVEKGFRDRPKADFCDELSCKGRKHTMAWESMEVWTSVSMEDMCNLVSENDQDKAGLFFFL